MDTFVDRIFIINIDARTDKYEQIVADLEARGIQNYERFSAIVPKSYDTPAIKALYNASYFGQGVVGCKLSHIQVIKLAKARGYNSILILEDDALFKPNFEHLIHKVITESERVDWDMLYLGANHKQRGDFCTSTLKRCTEAYTTSSYIIRSLIYDHVIDSINIPVEIDTFYARYIQPKFKCLCVYPNIMGQRKSLSDISHQITDYEFEEC